MSNPVVSKWNFLRALPVELKLKQRHYSNSRTTGSQNIRFVRFFSYYNQLIIIDNKKPKNAVKYFKVKSGGAEQKTEKTNIKIKINIKKPITKIVPKRNRANFSRIKSFKKIKIKEKLNKIN